VQQLSTYKRYARTIADRWTSMTAALRNAHTRDQAAGSAPTPLRLDDPTWSEQRGDMRLVTIHVSPDCGDWADRVELSAGMRAASRREVRELGYESGAFLPREPWRPLAPTEQLRVLSKDSFHDMARSIGIVRLPDGFAERCRHIKQAETEGPSFEAVADDLESVCQLGGPLHFHGAGSNPAGLQTVTIDRRSGQFTGLHLDSWDNLDLAERHRSSNRICVNIGQESRYFLFVPIALMDMPQIVAERLAGVEPPPSTSLDCLFVELCADVPVVRCRLAPGEAYIAPTECLLHDGSSVGQRYLDEQLTVRGFIRPHQRTLMSA
jgi:hypothetical protein